MIFFSKSERDWRGVEVPVSLPVLHVEVAAERAGTLVHLQNLGTFDLPHNL